MKPYWYIGLCFCALMLTSCEPINSPEEEDDSTSDPVVSEIYVYQAPATHPGYLGSRIRSNAACESEYNDNHTAWGITCTNYVALLGYTSDRGVQDIVSDFSIPTTVPIKTLDDVTFSDNISNLINNGPDITMSTSDTGIHDVEAMAGFANGGALTTNCDEWSSGATADTFTGIDISVSSASWNEFIAADCTTEIKPFFCLCW